MPEPHEIVDLLDWKRAVFALYAEIRASEDPAAAWNRWREVREDMFVTHPQSPLSESRRSDFAGLDYFGYDPAWRVMARLEIAEPQTYQIPASNDGSYSFTRFAIAHFEARGTSLSLECFWLDGYGGGLFLPFRDETSGVTTYGACRYLLDTIKGADLGMEDGDLVLDFNFAYNPSCSYDPRWVCPLAPSTNRLPVAVEAGERHRG